MYLNKENINETISKFLLKHQRVYYINLVENNIIFFTYENYNFYYICNKKLYIINIENLDKLLIETSYFKIIKKINENLQIEKFTYIDNEIFLRKKMNKIEIDYTISIGGLITKLKKILFNSTFGKIIEDSYISIIYIKNIDKNDIHSVIKIFKMMWNKNNIIIKIQISYKTKYKFYINYHLFI